MNDRITKGFALIDSAKKRLEGECTKVLVQGESFGYWDYVRTLYLHIALGSIGKMSPEEWAELVADAERRVYRDLDAHKQRIAKRTCDSRVEIGSNL